MEGMEQDDHDTGDPITKIMQNEVTLDPDIWNSPLNNLFQEMSFRPKPMFLVNSNTCPASNWTQT